MYRILCVEDETDFREDIATFLALRSFHADEARSGAEALMMIAREQPYDLVLCDIRMPDMSGYDLLRAVRRLEGERQLMPFIFLSALSAKENILEAKQFGCDEYLTKPVDLDVLAASIQARIERQRAMGAACEVLRQGLSSRLQCFIADEMYMPLAEIAHDCTQISESLPDNAGHAVHSKLGRMRQRSQLHAMRARKLSDIMKDKPLFATSDGETPDDAAIYAAQLALRSFGGEARHQIHCEGEGELPALPFKEVTLCASMLIEAAHRSCREQMQGLYLNADRNTLTLIIADRAEHLHEGEHAYITWAESTDLNALQDIVRGRILPLLYAERLVATLNGSIGIKTIDRRHLVLRLRLPALGLRTAELPVPHYEARAAF